MRVQGVKKSEREQIFLIWIVLTLTYEVRVKYGNHRRCPSD